MQATSILLFAFCLQVSATATYSQTVSFTGKDVPLKTVFAAVKKQTGYGVFYASGEAKTLEGTSNVTLDLKNVALDLFMRACLRNQPLEYSLEETTIFIKRKEAHISVQVDLSEGTPVAEVKGRVTNDKGEPLVNANVVVKRTGRGTVTDANGSFSIRNVSSDDVLQISFIGYKMQSIPVRDRSNFSLVMEPATNELDKMVVQAYGQTSQRLATGNIGVVRADDIAKQPVMNVLQAVQGQVPGVVVTNASGYASGTVKIEIRGRNSINPNFPSDPLYIIDGVPLTILDLTGQSNYDNGSQGIIQSGLLSPANGQSPFFSINPADIESIEILKDADATAIYGSRGSNGVILITTKKGKSGKTHSDLSVYTGISSVPKYYHMLNTREYVAMRKEALSNDGLPIDISNAPDLVAWDTARYVDWQKYLWGHTGKTIDAEASISGGDNRTTFRIGGGYHYLTEILAASGANKRGSLTFNINHKSLNQRLNMVLTGTYTVVSADMIYTPSAINLPPNAPSVFDQKGNLNYAGWSPLDQTYPFGSLLQPYTTKSNLLNSNAILNYELLKGLVVRTSLGYNNVQTNQTFLQPIASQDPAFNLLGNATFGYTFIHNLIIEPQLEYSRFIGKGRLNVLAGSSLQSTSATSVYLGGFGYTNDALLTTVANATKQISKNSVTDYKYEAIFGRINYNFQNKYILNLNARRDGSSKFGPGRQFGNFGSVGGAWIFSEESWLKNNLNFLSFGKIRASYGIAGSDDIAPFSYLSQWAFNQRTYNNNQVLNTLGHTDSTLHWQVNHKLEAAINLGFWEDRVTLEATYYRNRCNNQLVFFPTPNFTGFAGVTTNSPADVENKGWEFQVNGKIIDKKDFNWTSKLNIGINRNKLIAYPNLNQSPYANLYVIGKSLRIRKILHFTGVDPQTGLYTYQDRNHDDQITIDYTNTTSDDRYPIDMAPRFDGGITNTIRYKNWELSLFFYFKKQLGVNALNALDAPGDNTNQPTSVLKRWQKVGDITNVALFTTMPFSKPFTRYQQSDGIITDASFIRLQNLSLTYIVPTKISQKAGMQNFSIYVKGQNLFIITNYNGLDPEVQNFGNLPRSRVLTAGISCTF